MISVRIVRSSRKIFSKLKAKAVSVLIVQMYFALPEYEDDYVTDLYNVFEEILEEQCGWRLIISKHC
jgi:hypothetical protein